MTLESAARFGTYLGIKSAIGVATGGSISSSPGLVFEASVGTKVAATFASAGIALSPIGLTLITGVGVGVCATGLGWLLGKLPGD